MKNKMIKIFTIMAIILSIMFYNNVAFATGKTLTGLFDGETTGDIATSSGENMAITILGDIFGVVRLVGIGLSVIVLTYMGIKYMLAAPSEKADIKGQYVKFVIGVIIFVAAATILEVIRNVAQGIWT